MSRSFANSLGVLFLLAPSAYAQLPLLGFSGGGGGSIDLSYHGTATFQLPQPPLRVVPNAPYAGEQSEVRLQTLADGTHITQEVGFHQKAWRDSIGRLRLERSVAAGGRPSLLRNVPTLVEILDPLAGYAYIMDDVTRVAHRITLAVINPPQSRPPMQMQPPLAHTGPATPPATSPRLDSSIQGRPGVEQLGSQLIDGIEAIGTRITTMVPGGRGGTGEPYPVTREQWVSPELQLTILVITTDPFQGTSTNKIVNLSRAEPDPALFFVPLDYKVVDETQTFTVKWGQN